MTQDGNKAVKVKTQYSEEQGDKHKAVRTVKGKLLLHAQVMMMMMGMVITYLSRSFPGPPEQHSLNIH